MADRKRPKQGFWRARKPWRKQGFWRARPKPGSVQDVQERLFDAICEGNLKNVKADIFVGMIKILEILVVHINRMIEFQL